MLFRGDGKSSIHNYDSVNNKNTDIELEKFKPTIGFINPPYGGNGKTTPKEITFLIKLLDNCSRYALMIAPLSVYIQDKEIRNQILQKHTLKAVINMPKDLFAPNANTNTAICVFETNRPFNYNEDEVIFYDLQDDGFVLNKNSGRTDKHNKWQDIEKSLLDDVKNNKGTPDNIKFVKTRIKKGDEWGIYAFSKTDYSNLTTKQFIKTITDYLIYVAKKNTNILNNNDLNYFETMDILNTYFERNVYQKIIVEKIDLSQWKEYRIDDLFNVSGSKTTPILDLIGYGNGEYPYITTKSKNNGVEDFYNYYTEQANVLTIDSATVGSVFYQDKEFSASDHVEVLTPKNRIILNKYTALFFVTMIKTKQYKYGYGRKFNQANIKKESILLPSTPQGQPDFEYMEKFIKDLPYGDLL
jgi:hypothetical protein